MNARIYTGVIFKNSLKIKRAFRALGQCKLKKIPNITLNCLNVFLEILKKISQYRKRFRNIWKNPLNIF